MMNIIKQIDNDINDYDDIFNKLLITGWLIFGFIFAAWIFWFFYEPIILAKWFNITTYTAPNAEWGWWHTFFYRLINPPMHMLDYYNSCTDEGKNWYLILHLPVGMIGFTIVYLIAASCFYWWIWNEIIGPTIGDYLRPIVESALGRK